MTILSAMLLLLGSLCVYLSHPNQRWRRQPLTHAWRYAGIAAWLMALAGLLATLSVASALFSWCALLMTALPLVAFSGLCRREE